MADIKLTLSTDRRFRSPSAAAEKNWLKLASRLYYPLPHTPSRASTGDWVYFIRAGSLVGRARIVGFQQPGKSRRSYAGVQSPAPTAEVEVKAPMQLAKRQPHHPGFQGFRYLTTAEKTRFRACFA